MGRDNGCLTSRTPLYRGVLLHILAAACLYLTFLLFYALIGQRLAFRFWTELTSHLFALAWSLAITAPFAMVKRNKAPLLLGVLLVLDLLLLSNVWYYRTYHSVMPLGAFAQASNLDGLLPSIGASLKILDLSLLAPTLLLACIFAYFFRGNLGKTTIKLSSGSAMVSTLPILLLLLYNTSRYYFHDRDSMRKQLQVFEIDQLQAVRYYGLFSLWMWQASQRLDHGAPLKQERIAAIDNWLVQHRAKQVVCGTAANQKNVVLVLVESLESWAIGARVNGVELTPSLNLLAGAESTIYAPQVVPQTKHGRSSDAQFIINTGLLPVSDGAAFVRHADNDYFTLAKALREKGVNRTVTFVGDEPSFWNQGKMNLAMGFDSLVASPQFDMSDKLGMGLSDASFLEQSARKIKKLQQPFYLQLITLTSHFPFKIPKDRKRLTIPDSYPDILADYMQSIHYTDHAIGQFIKAMKKAGLFEGSVFVFVGDHEAFGGEQREALLKDKLASQIMSRHGYVPLLIVNAPQGFLHERVMGQVDIYPTLLDLTNTSEIYWRGMGMSILTGGGGYAIDARHVLHGDTTGISSTEFEHTRIAWEVSNDIVRANFFGKRQEPKTLKPIKAGF